MTEHFARIVKSSKLLTIFANALSKMFNWVLNTPLFTTILSLEKKSEWKDKQSSDILNFQTAEKVELHWITPTEAATGGVR